MKNKIDLSVSLAGVELLNPLVLASGFLGTEAELLARVACQKIGIVTTKSCSLNPRAGHENPTVIAWEHGLQNAVGLTNPGVEEEVKEIGKLKNLLKDSAVKISASFFGGTVEEFVRVAQELEKARPDFLEMNISCPNVASEFGRTFSAECQDTFQVVKKVKQVTNVPLIVKLSPNVTDIALIAKSAEDAGADVISAINTVNGMIVDIESGKPILTNKVGGLSGPAVKPMAVFAVCKIAQSVKVPVIGMGGVSYGKDAIEMVMAGAMAVGIGSAIYDRKIEVFSKVTDEMEKFMLEHNYSSLSKFRGIAYAKN